MGDKTKKKKKNQGSQRERMRCTGRDGCLWPAMSTKSGCACQMRFLNGFSGRICANLENLLEEVQIHLPLTTPL